MSNYHIPIKPPRWLRRRIRRCLKYYPKTGNLIWIKPLSPRVKIGNVAGTIKEGYIQIKFGRNGFKKNILAHHICWYLYYGEWPNQEIDHENTIGTDNSIINLRKATRRQAQRNRGLYKNNTIGITGIYFDKRRKKYVARIATKNGRIFLGSYKTLKQAKQIRRKAERRYFGKFRYRHSRN